MTKKHINLILAGLVSVMVFSCNYEEKDLLEGKGVSLIRMQISGPQALAAFDAVKQTRGILTINRDAVSNADLNSTASVDLVFDAAILKAYNDTLTLTDPFLLLPAAAYKVVGVEGGKFTFKPGEAVRELQLTLDPALLDLSASYALPVVIKNASSGYSIGKETNTVLVQVIVKNQYDGNYAANGTRYNYATQGDYLGWNNATNTPNGTTLSTPTFSGATKVSTRGAATVAIHCGNLLDGGFGYMNVTVNADNSVLIESSGETGLANLLPLDDKKSTYDPATKTFYLYYRWKNASGTFRVLQEVLVKN